LTFDDGPHPEHTPPVLDILRKERIAATFFVVGREAERFPELVRRIAAEGHVVANHSFAHADPANTTPREFLDDIRRSDELLATIVGRSSPSLLRPPFGRLSFAKLIGCWRSRQTIVLWNRDTRDFASRSAEEILARLRSRPWRGGDLVLLHDNHPRAAEALPALAADVRAHGLAFTTVDKWSR
jgi:peptidoglycan/xylan/chitin deacetylase (PgdA/CDA1 family)